MATTQTTTAVLDPQADRLPRANTPQERGQKRFPPEEFVRIPDVPIWAEHTTTLPDGRTIHFDREKLEQIIDRCNRRIEETGDYATVTIGHSSPRIGGPQPPVVGFAGPFRLGVMGDPPRYVVLADFHLYREHADVLKRFPRRSPELWLADDPSEMFLDPIALLGAETPRLDMGILYQQQGERGMKLRYTATAPSAGTVFVPSETGKKQYVAPAAAAALAEGAAALAPAVGQAISSGFKQGEQAGQAIQDAAKDVFSKDDSRPQAKEGTMNLTDEDIQAIVAQIRELPELKWVRAQMPEQKEPEGDDSPPPPEPPQDVQPEPEPPAPPPQEPEAAKGEEDKELYSRLQEQVESLQRRLELERANRINAERYARLKELAQKYRFDLEREMKRCAYGRMSDEQFQEHCQEVIPNYRPNPAAQEWLPVPEAVPQQSTERYERREDGLWMRTRYGREIEQRALDICLRAANRGEKLDYDEVCQKLASGQPVG